MEIVIKYDGCIGSAVEKALAVGGGQINDSTEQIFAEAEDPGKIQGAFVCAHYSDNTQHQTVPLLLNTKELFECPLLLKPAGCGGGQLCPQPDRQFTVTLPNR